VSYSTTVFDRKDYSKSFRSVPPGNVARNVFIIIIIINNSNGPAQTRDHVTRVLRGLWNLTHLLVFPIHYAIYGARFPCVKKRPNVECACAVSRDAYVGDMASAWCSSVKVSFERWSLLYVNHRKWRSCHLRTFHRLRVFGGPVAKTHASEFQQALRHEKTSVLIGYPALQEAYPLRLNTGLWQTGTWQQLITALCI